MTDDWFTTFAHGLVQPPAAQPDATAAPSASAPPQRTIGASTISPQQFAALPRAAVPSVPQGLAALLQTITDPSTKLGAVAGLNPIAGAAQAGRGTAALLDSGHPVAAALAAGRALLPGEVGDAIRSKVGGLFSDVAREGLEDAPFAIHEAGSDHPTLAPRYEFQHPHTGQPQEIVLAAEDGGKRCARITSARSGPTTRQRPMRTRWGRAACVAWPSGSQSGTRMPSSSSEIAAMAALLRSI